jgi:acylphosphatase
MTPDQKEEIHILKLQGIGYKTIAKQLCITVDMVKGYCKRNQLDGSVEVGLCLQCKKYQTKEKWQD